MDKTTIRTEWVSTKRLSLNPANPRINDSAVPHVAASIRRFGWRQPIVAKRSGEVVAGNTRLKAAIDLGLAEVPVVWFDGPDLEATAYMIADNRSAEFASWEEESLAAILRGLREEDALEGIGYDETDIDELLAELDLKTRGADFIDDPGPEEPPDEPVSRTGDLWTLGEHRLLCGDSTSSKDLDLLVGEETAALLSTDPPYCVRYSGADRPQNSGKDWSDQYNEVDIEDLGEFLRSVLTVALRHVRDNAGIYVWHAHLQYPVIDSIFEEFGILRHQPIIWVKPSSTFTYSYYRWAHEPCLFGWRKGHKPPHYLENGLSSVWEADWDGRARYSGDHPTTKPTRLFEIPMEQHTRPGELVLEPFSGSGTQLIAAEKLRRRCRAMEIEPTFVDAAVRRWEKATGRQAVLEGDGATFEEVARRRVSK